MHIREMSHPEIVTMLERVSIGHLACSVEDMPYVVPVRFVYHDGYLYSLTSAGKKMAMMNINRNVCINFLESNSRVDWRSLVITGIFEELPQSFDENSPMTLAHRLLSKTPEWWEPAYTRTELRGKERSLIPAYFRISVLQTTGHQALA